MRIKSPIVWRRSSSAAGSASFMDFYYVLKYSPEPDDWSKVMDALAVQETYLWREIDQLRTVVDCLVPGWSRRPAGGRCESGAAPAPRVKSR